MKPILQEGELLKESLRLGISRKASRTRKLWILQTEGYPARQVASISP